MAYISCADAAKAMGITIRRIQQMCKRGEIPGAAKEGRTWMIPEDAPLLNSVGKKKPLPIGVSDFKSATTEYYYVDKTLLIRDFLDTKPKVSLFTRPRRFGKTLNMDMLRYNDKPVTILIRDVFVYPQAFAAIAPQKSQLKHHLRLFLIDIGGYTTDVLLLRSGKPDMQFCRSLETGIITMNNDIIRRVGALHDMQIEDEHISAVLCGKKTILPADVKDTIRKSAEQHAKDILDQLRELKVDLRSNPAVFIGGGSVLFRDYLEHSPLVASASFVENVNANAIGYQAMAEGQLSLLRT